MAYPISMRCLWSSTPVIDDIWTRRSSKPFRRDEEMRVNRLPDEKASTV